VISSLLQWFDDRTGLKKFLGMMLLEGVPGGARWRYVFGSALAFTFTLQLVTGVLLMTAYSPSSSQAWNSVHYIQYKMDFGWLIRGLHHFGSQTMMVLIALHMLQVVMAGAHLPPREMNWWTGVGLLSVTLGLSLTGYLLPWDQKGFWATDVATNIAGTLPEVGADVKQQVVAGPDSGNHTLTRFYALHVAVLPGTLILLLIAHLVVFRRQGVTCAENQEGFIAKPENEHGAETFWPRQALYDLLACMLVFTVMIGLLFWPHKDEADTWHFGHGVAVKVERDVELGIFDYDYWARAGERGVGANLDAAADRDTADYPARPEWYFLPLFQLLKYFKGDLSIVGTVVIPNGVMLLLALLPLFGYGPMRKIGHFFGVFVVMSLLICAGILIVLAFRDDAPDGLLWGTIKSNDDEVLKRAEVFQKNLKIAEKNAQRACQLAMEGTPVEGGHVLLRNDSLLAGKERFDRNCGTCHNFVKDKNDKLDPTKTASDLGNFASQDWIFGLLKKPLDDTHFGLIKIPLKDDKGDAIKDDKGKPQFQHLFTGMAKWRQEVDDQPEPADKEKEKYDDKSLKAVAGFLAEQAKPKDKRDEKKWAEGEAAFFSRKNDNRCSGCHKLGKGTSTTGPDLTDYGSAEWLRGIIMNPGHKSRYKGAYASEEARPKLMPAFRNQDGPAAKIALQEFQESFKNIPTSPLTDIDRELIIRYMLHDPRPVYGGSPVR